MRFLPEGPLRTGTHPQGLPALSKREWGQVHIGSRLASFIFKSSLSSRQSEAVHSLNILSGRCGLWLYDPASIWSSRPARLCRLLRCFSAVSFDQCSFGSIASTKPATLLPLRLDTFRHEIGRAVQSWNWCICSTSRTECLKCLQDRLRDHLEHRKMDHSEHHGIA